MTSPRIGLTLLLLIASAAEAAPPGSGSSALFYRCRDVHGQTHYGDSMPPECQGQDTEVVNSRGMVVNLIEGTTTSAARAAQKEADQARQQEKEAAKQRDKMLIETYLSVQDIERLRDQRLDLLEAQLKVSEQHLAGLKDREARLAQQVARFKPYSDKPNAPPLPDHLAEELVNTVNGMSVDRASIAEKKGEQVQVKKRFDNDIRRFKELKGIK
jgi:hypothetical protein